MFSLVELVLVEDIFTELGKNSETPHRINENRLEFTRHHVGLFRDFIQNPSRIPGDNFLSKTYAVGVLPAVLPVVFLSGSVVRIKKLFSGLFKQERASVINRWEYLAFNDKTGTRLEEAARAWGELNGKGTKEPKFNYYVASMLLCMSSTAYWAQDFTKPELQKELKKMVWDSMVFSWDPVWTPGKIKQRGVTLVLGTESEDVIMLVFKGTTIDFFEECLSDAAFYRHTNSDEICKNNCQKVCYRHTYCDRKCSKHCTKVCYHCKNGGKECSGTCIKVCSHYGVRLVECNESCKKECATPAHIHGECNDKCLKICNIHHYKECDSKCIQGCDRHVKYLDGEVHQGFYNLLFKPSSNFAASRFLFEGPVCAMDLVMDRIFQKAFNNRQFYNRSHKGDGVIDPSGRPSHLWITGHSLGGALASLVMARLQTIVTRDDPLVRGLDLADQEFFEGYTVFDVMVSQFLKNYWRMNTCRACHQCDAEDWKNCKDCLNCKLTRTHFASQDDFCQDCQEMKRKMESEAIVALLEGCDDCRVENNDNCRDKSHDDWRRRRDCSKCNIYCGKCGDCNLCNIGRHCRECMEVRKTSLLILRDCYTFGSPKVGDTMFQQKFAENQRLLSKRPFSPAYWRIANEYDPVTRSPPGLDGYTPVTADSKHRSSLLDYQHVGYLVQLPNDSRHPPAVKLSTASCDELQHNLEERKESAIIQKTLQLPETPKNGYRILKADWPIFNIIRAPFRWMVTTGNLIFGLRSHSAAKYNDRLYSVRVLFASYHLPPSPNALAQSADASAQSVDSPVQSSEAPAQSASAAHEEPESHSNQEKLIVGYSELEDI